MAHTLSLDIGTKRTGVAFVEDTLRIPHPLDTIEHSNEKELVERVKNLVSERGITQVVIGLPLLPSGDECTQSDHCKLVKSMLEGAMPECSFELLDERQTSTTFSSLHSQDRDAEAAVRLLTVWLERQD